MNDFNNILSKELKSTNFSKILTNDDNNSKIKGLISVECKQDSLPSLTVCCISSDLTSSIWKLELSENIIINHFVEQLSIEVETGLKGYAQLFGKSLINCVSFGNLDNFNQSNYINIKFIYNIGSDPGIIQIPWIASELPSIVYEMMINIFNCSNGNLRENTIEDEVTIDYIGQNNQDFQFNETNKEKVQSLLIEDQNNMKTLNKHKLDKSDAGNKKKKKRSGTNI